MRYAFDLTQVSTLRLRITRELAGSTRTQQLRPLAARLAAQTADMRAESASRQAATDCASATRRRAGRRRRRPKIAEQFLAKTARRLARSRRPFAAQNCAGEGRGNDNETRAVRVQRSQLRPLAVRLATKTTRRRTPGRHRDMQLQTAPTRWGDVWGGRCQKRICSQLGRSPRVARSPAARRPTRPRQWIARDVAARTTGNGFDATATGDLYACGLLFNLARLRSRPWRLLNGSARPLRRGGGVSRPLPTPSP